MDRYTSVEFDLDSLFAQEPPLQGTADAIRTQARRVRRRRTTAVAIGAIVVTCGVVAGTSVALPDATGPGPAGGPTVADFSAGDLEAAMREGLIDGLGLPATPTEVRVIASDAQGNAIEGSDRAKATGWKAILEIDKTHVVELRVGHDYDSAARTVTDDCEDEVAAGVNLSCTLDTTNGLTQTIVRAVRRQPGAWAVILGDRLEAIDGPIWLQRAVTSYRDGHVVTATEFVRSDSHDIAESAWLTSTNQLAQVAARPDLRFPGPPLDGEPCGWIIPELDDRYSCSG